MCVQVCVCESLVKKRKKQTLRESNKCSHVISAWSGTWKVLDQACDQCMISHMISVWSATWSVNDSHVTPAYIYTFFLSILVYPRRLCRNKPGYIGGFATKTSQLKHQRMTVALRCNRMFCNIIFWYSDYLVFVAKSYYPGSSLTSSGQSLRVISEAASQAWSPQKIHE